MYAKGLGVELKEKNLKPEIRLSDNKKRVENQGNSLYLDNFLSYGHGVRYLKNRTNTSG